MVCVCVCGRVFFTRAETHPVGPMHLSVGWWEDKWRMGLGADVLSLLDSHVVPFSNKAYPLIPVMFYYGVCA